MRYLSVALLLLLSVLEAAAQDVPTAFGPRLEDALSGTIPAPNMTSRGSSIPPVLRPDDDLGIPRLALSLRALRPDHMLGVRGDREIRLYANASPAVVLIVTGEGIGSGSLIASDGTILTNWHVVSGGQEVGVVFKPLVEGQRVSRADVYRGRVVRVDEVADLALVKVEAVPPQARVLPLGSMARIQVGADVHAIGHPTGESWTYTKGIVSQIRRQYDWSVSSGLKHRADVIQTQTPINPGNSGGPLLSDDGQLVGVNSFKADGEGLNFAVAVDEVQRFLTAPNDRRVDTAPLQSPTPSSRASCEPRELSTYRTRAADATVTTYDLDCDGEADAALTVPDDRTKPVTLFVQSKTPKEPNVLFADRDRDGRWDVSLYDIDHDGKPDMIGYHRNGEKTPYKLEPIVASR